MHFSSYIGKLAEIYEQAGGHLRLNPSASEDQLDNAEELLGLKIDSGLRGAWAVADGGPKDSPIFVRPAFVVGFDFISVERALVEREEMAQREPNYQGYEDPEQRDDRIRSGWFRPGWVPFADFYGSMMLISDASPSPLGERGQIIAFIHDPDQIVYVARSFHEFLKSSLDSIEESVDEILTDL